MRMLLFLPLSLALGVSTFAGALPDAGAVALPPFGDSPGAVARTGDPFAGLPGRVATRQEAAARKGGDVVIKLNANRTQLTIDVYSNDNELRRLNPNPIQSVTIDAHNRVVNTINAPFMPADGGYRDVLPVGGALTTRPGSFPAGTWNITRVYERSGSYGPNMINTNAVGRVDVYADGVRIGSADDTGYAIHSNANDFSVSRSNGCIIVRAKDNALLASILRDDRDDAAEKNGPSGRSYQAVHAYSLDR